MKQTIFIFLLLVSGCIESKEPENYVGLDEFLALKTEVSNFKREAHLLRSISTSLGRSVLEHHLPDCVFIEMPDEPMTYWLARDCHSILKIKPEIEGARTVVLRVYKNEYHLDWFWKIESVEY